MRCALWYGITSLPPDGTYMHALPAGIKSTPTPTHSTQSSAWLVRVPSSPRAALMTLFTCTTFRCGKQLRDFRSLHNDCPLFTCLKAFSDFHQFPLIASHFLTAGQGSGFPDESGGWCCTLHRVLHTALIRHSLPYVHRECGWVHLGVAGQECAELCGIPSDGSVHWGGEMRDMWKMCTRQQSRWHSVLRED